MPRNAQNGQSVLTLVPRCLGWCMLLEFVVSLQHTHTVVCQDPIKRNQVVAMKRVLHRNFLISFKIETPRSQPISNRDRSSTH